MVSLPSVSRDGRAPLCQLDDRPGAERTGRGDGLSTGSAGAPGSGSALDRGPDAPVLEAASRGDGLVLGPDGHDRLPGVVDPQGQLLGPGPGVIEDVDEGLDHVVEGVDVVVPDEDGPGILLVEEALDVVLLHDLGFERLAHAQSMPHERAAAAANP